MSEGRKGLTKNILSLGLVQVANYLLPLISVPIVSRIIGPDKFGVINFSIAFIAYFNIIITYSFDFTATRKIARDPDNEENRSQVFSEVFFTQCLLFLFSTAVFTILLYTLKEFESIRNVLGFSYLLCISTLFTQNWLFQAMQQLSKVALFNLVSKVLFTVFILFVIRKEDDYIWQPFLYGTIQLGIAVWSFLWALKRFKIKLRKPSLRQCVKVLYQDRVIFISLIFVSLYTYTNTVVLGLFQNSEQVGYYTAAQRLIIIAQSVLSMPLAQAFYPYIGKAFAESRTKGLQIAQRLVSLIVLFIGLSCAIMFFLGPFVIKSFYGHQFEGAIPAFQILSLVPLFYTLNNVLGIQIMVNLGMDKSFLKISIFAAVISIIMNVLMIKHFGYIGSSLNWLITELFLFVSMYILLKRNGLNPIKLTYFKLSFIQDNLNFKVKNL